MKKVGPRLAKHFRSAQDTDKDVALKHKLWQYAMLTILCLYIFLSMILANLKITQYGLKTLLGYQRNNEKMMQMSEDIQSTVVPTKSGSDVILRLQLLSKTLTCTLYLSYIMRIDRSLEYSSYPQPEDRIIT